MTDGRRTNLRPPERKPIYHEEGGGEAKNGKGGRREEKREGRGEGEKIIGGGRGCAEERHERGRGSNRARYGHGRGKTNALGLLDYRERGLNEETEEEKVWR